jgi:hypothetical protein
MGLDQYAYVAAKKGQFNEFHETAQFDPVVHDYVNATVSKPVEIAYWRKHPNLHGWMEKLYRERGGGGDFNGDELELTWQDLDNLEQIVKEKQLPSTRGFFFGDVADDDYYENDLEFIRKARAELFMGLKVFYNSSW